jgi:hypothetical protein
MPPAGRFLVAFDDPTLEWAPTWTALDQAHPSLVTSYSIDRGRQFELDRTDTGRATVELRDRDGILDPTNSSSPYYGKLEPLLQAMIGRHNPMDDVWHTRYRGFIEDYDYSFDPSQRVNMLTVTLVDLFEILAAIELQPGQAGQTPPKESEGNIFFEPDMVNDRITGILGPTPPSGAGVGIPAEYWVVFSGNVEVYQTVYSPGENVLSVIQEAADGEFPGAPSNVYVDRLGRLAFHGRYSKFDPVGVHSGLSDPSLWEFVQWKVGDRAAVLAAPPDEMAQLRRFGFNRGLSKIINQATATPTEAPRGVALTQAEMAAQVVNDLTSQAKYGIRSWSAQELLTRRHKTGGNTDLEECKKYAEYYIANYAQPRNRVTDIGFRTVRPGAAGAGETWDLLSRLDISHSVEITIASPGGGGFNAEPFFVEGVHEQVSPLQPDYDEITMTLDLSPKAYYDEPGKSIFDDDTAPD